ncbi:MAG: methyltransferase domain-containing protein [Crinalium sp.]
MRLQLGTSRLENFPPKVLEIFLDETWTHLGDLEHDPLSLDRVSISYIVQVVKGKGIKFILHKGLLKFLDLIDYKKLARREDYNYTNFKEFYYQKGDRLPFDDNSLSYIFSEHFFEHLFFDEALSLLQECQRILKPGGVIRTCVPDADLRAYAPPEPVGYPDVKLAWNHPSKHKTRWSVYNLTEALRVTGFHPLPLYYCDKSGQHICTDPVSEKQAYEQCVDPEMVFSLNYIIRMNSLIVDGIKKPTS